MDVHCVQYKFLPILYLINSSLKLFVCVCVCVLHEKTFEWKKVTPHWFMQKIFVFEIMDLQHAHYLYVRLYASVHVHVCFRAHFYLSSSSPLSLSLFFSLYPISIALYSSINVYYAHYIVQSIQHVCMWSDTLILQAKIFLSS